MFKLTLDGHAALGRAIVTLTAAGALLLCTSCGVQTAEDRHQQHLDWIAAGYDSALRSQPPTFVVVTYPTVPSELKPAKFEEFAIIKRVLEKNHIPYATRRLRDALLEVTGEKETTYWAFDVPEGLVETVHDGVLLYLNLEMGWDLKTHRHPRATEHNVKVRVWNDPVAVAATTS